jgi:hypothetical protein
MRMGVNDRLFHGGGDGSRIGQISRNNERGREKKSEKKAHAV